MPSKSSACAFPLHALPQRNFNKRALRGAGNNACSGTCTSSPMGTFKTLDLDLPEWGNRTTCTGGVLVLCTNTRHHKRCTDTNTLHHQRCTDTKRYITSGAQTPILDSPAVHRHQHTTSLAVHRHQHRTRATAPPTAVSALPLPSQLEPRMINTARRIIYHATNNNYCS